jgi:cytochrome o ubiquinol oxidase subunit 3
MTHSEPTAHESYPDTHHDVYSKTIFGFWLYLLSDFMLFATLFATYIVLKNNTFGGPSAREIFDLPFALAQTIVLLTCSLTSGVGTAFAHRKNKNWTLVFFCITFLLGIVFLAIPRWCGHWLPLLFFPLLFGCTTSLQWELEQTLMHSLAS